MNNKALLRLGILGSLITALCCFTPVLTLSLSAVGLAALAGALDYVLLPLLFLFVAITGYAIWKRLTIKLN